MRTNRPNQAADPRHRKPGPARVEGADAVGKRARDVNDTESADEPGTTDSEENVAS